jgi:hypothetical protein
MEYAVGLGREAGAKAVLFFHHDPNRTDDQMDAAVRRFEGSDVPVTAAVQGTTIEL